MPLQPFIGVHSSEEKSWDIFDPDRGTNGEWINIPGLKSYTFSGGEREGRAQNTDSTDPSATVGTLGATAVDITALVSLLHRGWQLVDESLRERKRYFHRLTLIKNTILPTTATGTTAAVDTDGVVTFAGTTPARRHLREGADLVVGSNRMVIESVNQTTLATTVAPPSSAVSAGVYGIEVPSIRYSFEGWVTRSPVSTPELAEGADLEGSTMIQLDSPLAAPIRVT